MKEVLFLDMDGTIDDLYGVDDWLKYVQEESSTYPYLAAEPLVDDNLINILMDKYDVYVVTMTPRRCSKEYGIAVAEAKLQWIKTYFPQLENRVIVIESNNNKNMGNDCKIVLNTASHIPIPTKKSVIIDDHKEFRDTFIGRKFNENFIEEH